MFHISVSSLRHYEKIGLLTPEYVSPDSGYRYYGASQFEILNTIRYLRTLDMPLSEIEDFLKNRDIKRIEEKLLLQKSYVQKKLKELRRIERKIDHRLQWLKDAQELPLDIISVIQCPPCRMVWVEEPVQINSYQDMESPIRRLDRSRAEAVIFLGKVGLGISVEHLRLGQTHGYDGIFLMLDSEDIYDDETVILPESLCARLRFRGGHAQAPEQYDKLLCYIRESRFEIAGFSRETTLIDYGVTNDVRRFVTEICIPVCRSDQ